MAQKIKIASVNAKNARFAALKTIKSVLPPTLHVGGKSSITPSRTKSDSYISHSTPSRTKSDSYIEIDRIRKDKLRDERKGKEISMSAYLPQLTEAEKEEKRIKELERKLKSIEAKKQIDIELVEERKLSRMKNIEVPRSFNSQNAMSVSQLQRKNKALHDEIDRLNEERKEIMALNIQLRDEKKRNNRVLDMNQQQYEVEKMKNKQLTALESQLKSIHKDCSMQQVTYESNKRFNQIYKKAISDIVKLMEKRSKDIMLVIDVAELAEAMENDHSHSSNSAPTKRTKQRKSQLQNPLDERSHGSLKNRTFARSPPQESDDVKATHLKRRSLLEQSIFKAESQYNLFTSNRFLEVEDLTDSSFTDDSPNGVVELDPYDGSLHDYFAKDNHHMEKSSSSRRSMFKEESKYDLFLSNHSYTMDLEDVTESSADSIYVASVNPILKVDPYKRSNSRSNTW